MQRSVFFSILLTLAVNYQLSAAGSAFLASEQRTDPAAAPSQLVLESSKHNVPLQRGRDTSAGERQPSSTLRGRSLTRWLWRRPGRSFSALLVGAIAATTCITFLLLSCFRSLTASHGSGGTVRNLKDPRPGWLCDVDEEQRVHEQQQQMVIAAIDEILAQQQQAAAAAAAAEQLLAQHEQLLAEEEEAMEELLAALEELEEEEEEQEDDEAG